MTPLEIRPLDEVGAEVFGADLSRLPVGDGDQLEAAFAAFGLLVFRDQVVHQADLVAFAQRWGEVEVADAPLDAGSWRTDGSCLATPPLATLLCPAGAVPPNALSRFCSTRAAYEVLTSTSQRELEGLTALHADARGATAHHPVVIAHPLSGTKTLFVNPTYTAAIDDMDELNGLALLNQLTAHCQQREFIADVEWLPGTVVLVDNRSMWCFDRPPGTSGSIDLRRLSIAGNPLEPATQGETNEPTLVQRAGATLAGGVITAAMTGIAEVIEPEKARPDVEIVSEAPEPEPLTPLDFGSLPPLE